MGKPLWQTEAERLLARGNGQVGFSTSWDGYKTKKDAMQARNKAAKYIKDHDPNGRVVKWALPNQMRKYSGFGQYDGSVTTVYMINYN